MVPFIAFIPYVFWNRTAEKKVLQLKNARFFSFKCLICDFSQKLLFYNSVLIRIRLRIQIRTFFGFGSSQNIRIISDLDSYPQHCSNATGTGTVHLIIIIEGFNKLRPVLNFALHSCLVQLFRIPLTVSLWYSTVNISNQSTNNSTVLHPIFTVALLFHQYRYWSMVSHSGILWSLLLVSGYL
jgi:hypothetical protein